MHIFKWIDLLFVNGLTNIFLKSIKIIFNSFVYFLLCSIVISYIFSCYFVYFTNSCLYFKLNIIEVRCRNKGKCIMADSAVKYAGLPERRGNCLRCPFVRGEKGAENARIWKCIKTETENAYNNNSKTV